MYMPRYGWQSCMNKNHNVYNGYIYYTWQIPHYFLLHGCVKPFTLWSLLMHFFSFQPVLLSFFIIVNCMVFKIYYTVLPMYLQLMCHPNTCTTNEPTYTLHPQSPLQEVSNRLCITAGAEPAGWRKKKNKT